MFVSYDFCRKIDKKMYSVNRFEVIWLYYFLLAGYRRILLRGLLEALALLQTWTWIKISVV